MNITYKERQELNALSKEAFGISSKWQKLVNKGFHQLHERDREVTVPTRNGLEIKVVTDQKLIHKSYTVEEIRKIMEEIVESRKPKEIHSDNA